MRSISLLGIFSVALFLGSCTVEKRQYMPGWNVEWKGEVGKRKSENGKGKSESEIVSKKEQHNDVELEKLVNSTQTQETNAVTSDYVLTTQPRSSMPTSTNASKTELAPLCKLTKSKPFEFTKRGLSILKDKQKKTDQLILGILLFVGGLAAMIGIAFAYSGYATLPAVAIVLLVVCLIACIVGYILIEDAVPGLGCLLLMLLQIFAAVLG